MRDEVPGVGGERIPAGSRIFGMVMSETESELLRAHLVVISVTAEIGRIPGWERLGGFPVGMGSGREIGIPVGNARIKKKFPFPASLPPFPP